MYLKQYKIAFLLLAVTLSSEALADKFNTHVGDSYFTPTEPGLSRQTISQVGLAFEEHASYSNVYAFINQLLPNHIHYELRAYAAYHYISQYPPAPPLVPTTIPITSERNVMGYGGVGLLGYNIEVNPKVSFMPFVRLEAITNIALAYQDTLGNQERSKSYSAYLGSKLSMRVNEVFALYIVYYAGSQYSLLSGTGAYATTDKPTINAPTSVLEFGMPYKITRTLNITPYIQLYTTASNPNWVASSSPYSITQLTSTSTVFALKAGYAF